MYRDQYHSDDTGGYSQSNGYSPDGPVAQRSGSISRPSAKTIYQQRKEYAESMLKQPDNFQYRVEHLFTCGLDQKEVRSVDDCIARLKLLDAKGRVWGQDMILQVKDGSLQLTDIETKEELESFSLDSVQECTAVLQSCVYNSILTVTVRERSRRGRSVFLFQCEEVGAEHIQSDMEKLLQEKRDGRGDQDNIRNNLESMLAQPAPGRFQGKPLPPPQPENRWSGPDQSIPSWDGPDYDEFPNFDQHPPREEERKREEPEIDMVKSQRNMEILNHVLSDVELFTQQLNEGVAAQSTGKKDKKSKKKSKKEKGEQNIVPAFTNPMSAAGLPSLQEFASCLQKMKYGFNLLSKLDGRIQNPSASDLVHVLFPALSFIMSHCPEPDLPASILSPLLIQPAVELLKNNVTPDEHRIWKSLGEAWNLPRSLWPDADSIPPYVPEFSDGWEPPVPEPTRNLERDHRDRRSQRSSRTVPEQQPNSDPRSFPPIRANEQPHFMRVMYDFMARNSQELSIMKGEILLVLDKSRKWFRARNIREEEGFVPNNVLEPVEEEEEEHNVYQDLPPTLNRKSRPEDVKAWLQYKGFSKITVRCLGVLSGSLLLGMTRDEIKTVCLEEGGRVFFQLQAVKSSLALASENYGH
ncbi:epidermal growth factor receptor kinase substrate 8 [Huso huso]|uniref:Epidermal growth factor receptor kinase substrate 8 n=1 Tax=Huso huso TaxID=61971 RepID=A0ABR0YHW1_HUSHU